MLMARAALVIQRTFGGVLAIFVALPVARFRGTSEIADLLFFGNVESRFGALQRVFCAGIVDFGGVALQALFGAVFGFLRARNVDFLRTLRRFRQDRNLVGQDFRKAPCYG